MEEALVLLSLGSGTFCQAPTLPHPSRGGGSNCPTRWLQLSDKVVIIVRQRLFCQTISTTFQQKYRAVPILWQGGPNGQNLSGNVDHQINLLYYSASISFKHILVCLNRNIKLLWWKCNLDPLSKYPILQILFLISILNHHFLRAP